MDWAGSKNESTHEIIIQIYGRSLWFITKTTRARKKEMRLESE